MPDNSDLYSEKKITLADALDHGLTEEEFEKIKEYLSGRTPTVTELGIYSGMWSEHCSYKNSILQLKRLPTESSRSLTKTGEENAGALDIGDDLAVVFKIESHNHPTAIEPYQGAATGVGGIMRDIFTMGARPICSLNSLRFGKPDQPKNRYLLKRAVKGIGDYGNSLGVAVSGGELFFDESFNRNCLVNAMTVGIVSHQSMATAKAAGEGNPVFIVGATTGRDGIHGASFASKDLSKESESKRSAVQVGDPFMEKLLLEATLELIASDSIIGIQDMGAAGISCSTSEMSAKGKVGMDIDLDLVPLRETEMNAYEIMLSESQERMLVCVKKGREDEVKRIFHKWDLNAVQVGRVTLDKKLKVRRNGKLCSDIPADSLVLGGGAPRYVREQKRPDYLDIVSSFDLSIYEDLHKDSLSQKFYDLLRSPNLCSKRPLYEQYDTEVGLVKVIGPGADGGVARVLDTNRGIAVSVDCNSRYVYLNPERGTAQAVAESARNVAVTGAVPIGITNCLNFGNPYIPENYYIFAQAIEGMSRACRAYEIPVTGGNVSFYNESQDGPVYPTPTIGMVGLIDDLSKVTHPFFKSNGDLIYLIGSYAPSLGGSEYQYQNHHKVTGDIPPLDLNIEVALTKFLHHAAKDSLLESAKDLSMGGVALALFKSAYNSASKNSMGFHVDLTSLLTSANHRNDLLFFGETNGCVIVTIQPPAKEQLKNLTDNYKLSCIEIGKVTNEDYEFGFFRATKEKAVTIYEAALEQVF